MTPPPARRFPFWLLVLAVAFAAPASAATIVDLGASFVPIGINVNGVIVGDVVDPSDDEAPGHAAIWSNGVVTPLPETPGTVLSDAFAISDAGTVVGLEFASFDFVYAAYWQGVLEPTRMPPASEGFDFSQVLDIDRIGDMVGVRTLSEGDHPSLGFHQSVAEPPVYVGLGDLPDDAGSSRVAGISGNGAWMLGEITGADDADGYYLWSTSAPEASGQKLAVTPTRSPFPLFGASVYGSPLHQNAIAYDGTVLGYRDTGEGRKHFLRWPDGSETPVVGLAGYNAINDDKTVVGTVTTGIPSEPIHAAKWDYASKTVTDLNMLLPASSGWVLTVALAVGDDGDIVGLGVHNGVQTAFLLEGAAISVRVLADGARITIQDWRGEPTKDFELIPPRLTAFGTTVVPIHVHVVDEANDEAPVADELITLRATESGGAVTTEMFGLTFDPEKKGSPSLQVRTDENGRIDLFFRTDDVFRGAGDGPLVTDFTISAQRSLEPPAPVILPVFDNRRHLFNRYLTSSEYIPNGATSDWRAPFRPPFPADGILNLPAAAVAAVVKPGNAPKGSVYCSEYQPRVLILLHDIRNSDEGWLVNGLDYGPLQTSNFEHHFVGLYPASEPYNGPNAIILDPWLAQMPVIYTWAEFANFVDTFDGGAHIVPDFLADPTNPGTCRNICGASTLVPPPYPLLGGRYPYFPQHEVLPINAPGGAPLRFDGCGRIPDDWCRRHGFGGTGRPDIPKPNFHATAVVGSPVKFHVTMPDGRGFGYPPEAPDTFVNDLGGEFTTSFVAYPKPGGEQGWYVEVPGPQFRFEAPAFDSGTMSVAILGVGGVPWGGYLDVPVTAGTSIGFDVDLDVPCAPLALPGGGTVSCTTACTAGAGCDDRDSCTADGCTDNLCVHTALAGMDAARCVCDRPPAAACEGRTLPKPLAKAAPRACQLLTAAAATTSAKKAGRLVKKSAAQWTKAARTAAKKGIVKKLGPECAGALSASYREAAERARAAIP